VVLTGGGAALQGLEELVEASFSGPVRTGVPGEGLDGLVDSIRRPRYATAVGLALYGAGRQVFDGTEGGAGGASPVSGVIKSIREWLKDFF
jgi:cell division protein FtsA